MSQKAHAGFRYYDLIMAAFCVVLVCSNFIGAGKVCQIWGFTFGAGILFFPISYLFGDILTEVYGYARSRKVVWAGFSALAFTTFFAWFVLKLNPAPGWGDQAAYEKVFGSSWRIALASLLAFWAGEFANSFVLAKLKVRTAGKMLWMRTIGSTIIGELVDSAIFYPLAFLGLWETDLVIKVLLTNYSIKVLWEVFMTPVTYRAVAFLKRAENEDYFDRATKFNPFSLRT